MTPAAFRKLALSLPEAVEGAHMDHPDFRVRGKIFATLHPDGVHGVVMLTPEQQDAFVASAPTWFVPAAGAWGRRGCTQVVLEAATVAAVRAAMASAWRNKAPASLGGEAAARPARPGRSPRRAGKPARSGRRRRQ